MGGGMGAWVDGWMSRQEVGGWVSGCGGVDGGMDE